MKITYLSAECAPFIKVGGLADVVGALPREIASLGADADVILPLCEQIALEHKSAMKFLFYTFINVGKRHDYAGVFHLKRDGVNYYFIDNEHYFKRTNIYGYGDDAERFSFFSMAALEILPRLGDVPNILHFNDWQAAIAAIYLENYRKYNEKYRGIRTVLNIHNIEFQGKFDMNTLGTIFGLDENFRQICEYDGALNILKAGICLCDKIVAVSKNYAQEILHETHSHRLHYILQENRHKLCGITNGIDCELYNPACDEKIAHNFEVNNLAGKAICKRDLQQRLKLEVDDEVPIFAMITRLERQKGIELLQKSLHKILQANVQVIVLGSGNFAYEEFLRRVECENPAKMRTIIGFNEDLARKIYAGADFFLMPSLSEPCGLAQLIAMQYGAIPVVHAVGGLAETVEAYNPAKKSGVGITFQNFETCIFEDVIECAIEIFNNKDDFAQVRTNAMTKNFSWHKSALKYFKIYEKLARGE